MAISLISQTIHDGPVNLVVKTFIAGDTEYSDDILIKVSGFSSPTPDGTNPVRVMKVEASLTGFSAKLLWDATTNVGILHIPETEDFHRDYRPHGGIPNDAGTGITGDILITSTGFVDGDEGSITIWMRKT